MRYCWMMSSVSGTRQIYRNVPLTPLVNITVDTVKTPVSSVKVVLQFRIRRSLKLQLTMCSLSRQRLKLVFCNVFLHKDMLFDAFKIIFNDFEYNKAIYVLKTTIFFMREPSDRPID